MKQAVKLILLYLVYQLLASALMIFLGKSLGLSDTDRLGWTLLLSGIVMIVHLVLGHHIDKTTTSFVTIPFSHILNSICCAFGTMICFNALNTLIPLPNWLEGDFIALSKTLTGILSITLVAPVVEEILFRGAIISHMQQLGYPPTKVILLSAALFGFIHFNPAQVVFAFLMGTVFGWIRLKTNSLIPVIIGHILNNSLSVAEMYLYNSDGVLTSDNYFSPTTLILTALVGAVIAVYFAIKLSKV